MTKDNTQFLRFSAYSIKELITRKLSEDTKFTDQIYEGSNLAILIDLVSYMYQCLLYQLNSAAAESMFADTQIYENINRLVRFIGYNPKGYSPSTVVFAVNEKNRDKYKEKIAYRYSAIDTGKNDSNGKKVYYSLIEDKQFNTDNDNSLIFYNGLWKLYSTIFTSSGTEHQTFILDGISSDSEKRKYISDNMIHVYVKEQQQDKFIQWKATSDGLFIDKSAMGGYFIYGQTDEVYNVRLNEDKVYELTFGDNSRGKIPPKGSEIYIMYLDSNDEKTEIIPLEAKDKKLMHSSSLFGFNSEIYNYMFGDKAADKKDNFLYNTTWSNITKSSTGHLEETVDEIRLNAPQWFKTGNRLVTASDYEYFIKTRYKSDIIDMKCQNNAEYISTFYRWLYNIGLQRYDNGGYYITPNRMAKHDLRYADAADSNNVYLWIKMQSDAEIYKDIINDELAGIKTLTHEPVYLKPIDVYISPCAQEAEQAREMFFSNIVGQFDPDNYSYIEITIENNTLYANSNIQQQVSQIIQNYFTASKLKLGQIIDNSSLINKIYEIKAISNIRTVYFNPVTSEQRILPGISFAAWSVNYIDYGDDLVVSPNSIVLEPFQFPILYNSSNISNKIKVIRKAINKINTIKY